MRGLGLCSVNKYLAEAACGRGICGHPEDADVRHRTSVWSTFYLPNTLLSTGSHEQKSLLRGSYQSGLAVEGGDFNRGYVLNRENQGPGPPSSGRARAGSGM